MMMVDNIHITIISQKAVDNDIESLKIEEGILSKEGKRKSYYGHRYERIGKKGSEYYWFASKQIVSILKEENKVISHDKVSKICHLFYEKILKIKKK